MAKIVCTSVLLPGAIERLKDAGHTVWAYDGKGSSPARPWPPSWATRRG